MRNVGLSDRVRELVSERYVQPALRAGRSEIVVSVKDVLNNFSEQGGFPRFRTPVICQALLGNKILIQNGLEIERVDGPASQQSRTVVVHYRVKQAGPASRPGEADAIRMQESSEEWASRLTNKLHGLLKEELTAHGGGEAFLKWMRAETMGQDSE